MNKKVDNLCPYTGDQLVTPFRYDNNDDVNMRLGSSYIFYKGRAAFVYGYNGEKKLCVNAYYPTRNPEGDQAFSFHSSSIHLDLTSPQLGWINSSRGTSGYLSRLARRRGKQGVDESGTTVTCPLPHPAYFPRRMRDFSSPEIVDMLEGNYPTFEQSWQLVDKGGHCMSAFDREFAIGRDQNDNRLLFYKKFIFGVLDKNRGFRSPSVVVYPQFYHSYYLNKVNLLNIGVV